MARMTDEEFNKQQEELLKNFHPKLASVIRYRSYEDGHSAGREEVLNYVMGYVADFEEINKLLGNVPCTT